MDTLAEVSFAAMLADTGPNLFLVTGIPTLMVVVLLAISYLGWRAWEKKGPK